MHTFSYPCNLVHTFIFGVATSRQLCISYAPFILLTKEAGFAKADSIGRGSLCHIFRQTDCPIIIRIFSTDNVLTKFLRKKSLSRKNRRMLLSAFFMPYNIHTTLSAIITKIVAPLALHTYYFLHNSPKPTRNNHKKGPQHAKDQYVH